MALGSNGRGEITLFSDQDNAIVFDDSRTSAEALRPWFLAFARRFCEPLDRGGFRFCPGGILASSEAWCLGLSEWERRIGRQASGEVREGIQQLHALCDCAHLFGEESLTLAVREALSGLAGRDPGFVPRFARPVLGYPVPVFSGSKPVNIKDCLLILEGFARIYALRSGIPETSSVGRINALTLSGAVSSETRRDFVYLFESLWKLRFRNQLASWTRLEKNGDLLQRDTLTGVELRQVSVLIQGLPYFIQKINRDLFGGVAEL